MTDQPYRAPDAVLQLEQQLRDKSEECEDLRAALENARSMLSNAKDPREERLKAEEWTWRFVAFVVAAVAISIAYFVWRYNMKPEAQGACREVLLADRDYEQECPYGGQTQITVGDRIKCTCPSVAPAGSVKP